MQFFFQQGTPFDPRHFAFLFAKILPNFFFGERRVHQDRVKDLTNPQRGGLFSR